MVYTVELCFYMSISGPVYACLALVVYGVRQMGGLVFWLFLAVAMQEVKKRDL